MSTNYDNGNNDKLECISRLSMDTIPSIPMNIYHGYLTPILHNLMLEI